MRQILAKPSTLHLSWGAMADFTLDRLVARARTHRMTAQQRREQAISSAVGNATVEGQALYRGTVTIAVPRGSQPISTDQDIGSVPFDVNGSVRQFSLVQALVDDHANGKPVEISPKLIRELHAAGGDAANPIVGTYRTVAVAVSGSRHRPPAATDVPEAVAALCDHLKARWAEDDAIALSAYALWRLNWIHPFVDGNGRTARALCYLVLNLKLGTLLPGSTTLFEQLKQRRTEYFDALAAADISYATHGEPDLVPLTQLLKALLLRQLRSFPALSERDEAQLAEIVTRRIKQLDPRIRERLFGSAEVAHRTWSSADHFLVHVGPSEALEEAEALFARTEQPFPGLLGTRGEPALLTLSSRDRGTIVRPRVFEVTDGAALWLEPNAAAVIERPAVSVRSEAGQAVSWALGGVLYILRFGDEITELWAFDVLDMLVARHIQEAR